MSRDESYYRKKFGLSLKWKEEERREVTNFHHGLLQKLKEQYGVKGIAEIPGALESMQRMHNEGYSLGDIGVAVGLRKQSIYWIFLKHDLKVNDFPYTSHRIFNWKKRRFVPAQIEEFKLNQKAKKESERKRIKILQAEIDLRVKAIRSLGRFYGRQPSVKEVGHELGFATNPYLRIARPGMYLRENQLSAREALNDIYRKAGYEEGYVVKPSAKGYARIPRKPETIGARLTLGRLEKGLSQADVSKLTGISQSTIFDNETNRTYPSPSTLWRYSKLYGKSMGFLREGEKSDSN